MMDRLIQRLARLSGPHVVLAVVGAASVFALLGAQFFERVIQLNACDLCYQQRTPYWIAAGVALAALVLSRLPRAVLTGLAAIALLCVAVSGGIAGYHTGIEQGWWPGPSSCTGTGGGMPGSFSDFQQGFDSAKRITPCDQIPWSIFGLSIAALNGLFALGTIALGLFVWRRRAPGGEAATLQKGLS